MNPPKSSATKIPSIDNTISRSPWSFDPRQDASPVRYRLPFKSSPDGLLQTSWAGSALCSDDACAWVDSNNLSDIHFHHQFHTWLNDPTDRCGYHSCRLIYKFLPKISFEFSSPISNVQCPVRSNFHNNILFDQIEDAAEPFLADDAINIDIIQSHFVMSRTCDPCTRSDPFTRYPIAISNPRG